MNYYQTTKLNIPETYAGNIKGNSLILPNIFHSVEGEVATLEKRFLLKESIENILDKLDEIDHEIIWRITYSRCITPEQLLMFFRMQKIDVDMYQLNLRLDFLNHNRVIWRGNISQPNNTRITFLELDVVGNKFIEESGMVLHNGIQYKSRVENTGKEISLMHEKVVEIKRYLMANQILVALLREKAVIERFSFQEILRGIRENDWTDHNDAFRSNLKVDIDKESILSYWVVRDKDDNLPELQRKVERYYNMLSNTYYLVDNLHRDCSYPQVIICGENEAHNAKIHHFLKDKGLIQGNVQLLYTEDKFYFSNENSTEALYEFDENNIKTWYEIPTAKK